MWLSVSVGQLQFHPHHVFVAKILHQIPVPIEGDQLLQGGEGAGLREAEPLLPAHHLPEDAQVFDPVLEWKLMSLSHGQELGQLADLASDWLFTLVQPIRSQLAC